MTDRQDGDQRIADRLAGQHLLVTGSTGFLAKAFVEKLLRSVDTIASIHLLVRPRSDGSTAHQRVQRDVLQTRAFDRLRASLGDGFQKLCDERIRVVAGDLTKPLLGIDESTYAELRKTITLIVNSAATVTFDEQLDLAIQLNTLGPSRLLQFARDCGDVPLMHVSTCYVGGVRHDIVVEDFSAPEPARERLPRCDDTGAFDFDALLASNQAEVDRIKERCGAGTEACRRELIDAGMRLARHYGWNDTYTYTKWIGEQLLIRDHGKVPVVVFRPAIIEGSFEEPTPGWIDGLRMADPIIVAVGKGKLNEFPAISDVALDLIPVDFVANAMIATLPSRDLDPAHISVYHCGSSGRHPLTLHAFRRMLDLAFHKRPMIDEEGKPIETGRFHFVSLDHFMAKWARRRRRIEWLQKLYGAIGVKGRKYRRLSALTRQIEQLTYFAKIYSPYTHLTCRFADDELQRVAQGMHPEDRELFPFEVTRIDWEDYVVNRHVPGLRLYVLGTGSEPTSRIRAAAEFDHAPEKTAADSLAADHLFEVFRRTAQRFKHKPALQVRRGARWIRYSYDDTLRATGTIMRRFHERGLCTGDRVAICSESSPEWGLTYLAAMRAGLTAVPLDPQLPAAEAWSAARFADAKLMCASPATASALGARRGDDDAAVVVMREPFIPPPGASRDTMPEAEGVDGNHPASILFTSGTTIAAKAVVLTHRNLIANAQALLQVHRIDPTDELLSVLPMYHAFEFTGGFIVPLASGATITYVENMKAPEIRGAMQTTGTTVMLVVPRLLSSFSDSIDTDVARRGWFMRTGFRTLGLLSRMSKRMPARFLFRSVHKRFGGRLRMFVCGGSQLDPELLGRFQRMGFPVYEGYGLTETSPVLTLNPPGQNLPASVGKALPNVEIEIRNQNLEGIGEVWVSGPSITSGYLNNPQATAEVLVDGWFNTGDLGRRDDAGNLFLTGRSKDLIVTGAGKNVYPDEVEMRYRDLPYVKELCVFGMESPGVVGDAVHAVVVIDSDAVGELDRSSVEREIRMAAEAISEPLPSHQRIAVIHFWGRELPKTSTLKAKRGLIRERVRTEKLTAQSRGLTSDADTRDGASRDATPENSVAFEELRKILSRASRQPAQSIQRDSHLLLDLGIDSIGKIDVIGEVEGRFGMDIDDETAAKIARVSNLLAVVGVRRPLKGGKKSAASWSKRIAAESAEGQANGRLAAPLVPVRWLLRGGASLFLKTYVRVKAKGREHIPTKGAFILAPNHASHLDSPSVLQAVGGRRRVWIAGAEDYFFNTRLKRFVFGKVLDTIAFDRQGDGMQGLRRCGDALTRGDGLLIFPEGTRSISGEIQPFKIGVAVLAVERNVPIIPVYVDRAYDLLPKGARVVRPGSITVTFGEPIRPPAHDQTEDHYQAFRDMTAKVEAAVLAMDRKSER